MTYHKIQREGLWCGYCRKAVEEDVLEHRITCAGRLAYVERQRRKFQSFSDRYTAIRPPIHGGKFMFMAVRKESGRLADQSINATINRSGLLYIGKRAMDALEIPSEVVTVQLFADYVKRAIGFKIIRTIKMGDEVTVKDSSVRFLKILTKPSLHLIISIQRILDKMGYDYKESRLRVEILKYTDTWTSDIWYFTVPHKNADTITPLTSVSGDN